MNFTEYCHSKKIDAASFQIHEPGRFSEWEHIFNLAGAISFTQQKLFLINDVRRRFKYIAPTQTTENQVSETVEAQPKPAPKPMGFKPKFK